ncbi:ArsR family transcriptional regulator [Acrocarpospora pleiomorpha]|uniref:ArsR family transcriptional regulator n=1 Tax=Acrocarpospora pleiomorpha TaxID=90975 RepID=UPI0012D360EB|nr:ArsR family transcriptional regulator [Acrocarpospora pleiomorpha]
MIDPSRACLLEDPGMQLPPPPIFPIFRSRITCAVLTLTYVSDHEHSVSELAEATSTDTGTMAREVSRLEQAAILTSRHVGRTKLVRPNRAAPFYQPLLDLVTITLGPAQVLAEELAGLDRIEEAAVFGSWAARMQGEPGPAPVDIDLLVVGRPDRDDLHDASARAGSRLGRAVNTVIISRTRWEANEDGFIRELHTRPRVPVLIPALDGQ